jgi:hypothetical protein
MARIASKATAPVPTATVHGLKAIVRVLKEIARASTARRAKATGPISAPTAHGAKIAALMARRTVASALIASGPKAIVPIASVRKGIGPMPNDRKAIVQTLSATRAGGALRTAARRR